MHQRPETRERRKPEIYEIGFVDGLDRRYPVPKGQLENILDESLTLPTTVTVYVRKEHPEDRVVAFQVVNPGIIQTRSTKKPRFRQNRLLFWR